MAPIWSAALGLGFFQWSLQLPAWLTSHIYAASAQGCSFSSESARASCMLLSASYPGQETESVLFRLLPNNGPNRARAGQMGSSAVGCQRPNSCWAPDQASIPGGQVAPPRLPGWMRAGCRQPTLCAAPRLNLFLSLRKLRLPSGEKTSHPTHLFTSLPAHTCTPLHTWMDEGWDILTVHFLLPGTHHSAGMLQDLAQLPCQIKIGVQSQETVLTET